MKTSASPAINVFTALSSGTPAAKPSGTSSDMQFNQMLSRGIEERNRQAAPRKAEASKPAAKESTPEKQATQSSPSSAKTNKSESGKDKSTSVEQEASAPAGQSAAATVEHGKAKPAVDAEKEEQEAVLAASSDELLALVANLTQAGTFNTSAAAAVEDATQAVPVDADADAKFADADAAAVIASAAGLGTNRSAPVAAAEPFATGLTETATKGDITAQTALTAARKLASSDATTSKQPVDGAEFNDSLAQAKDRKGSADTTTARSQAQASENELAAATQPRAEQTTAKAAIDTQPTAMPSINMAPQSQASLQQVQAAASAASDKLAPRVGSNGWDQAVGQKVVWMVAGELQSASLTLNPPDLGPLEVVLNVSNNEATVNFTSAQPEVRQALEDAVPKLREMLSEAGIQLGQANVSAGTPNNQQGEFGQRQHASRGNGAEVDDGADAPAGTVRSQAITGGGQGLVDTFA
jgi:flagellar hook-length control protein FliK